MLQAIALKSQWRQRSAAIISALNDGSLQLCVIGRDRHWQLRRSQRDSSKLDERYLGSRSPLSREHQAASSPVSNLDITVAGADVLEYKYKIRVAATTACSDSTGYSSAVAVATHITNDITALADGGIEVCVIGKDSSGNWQAEASASTASWTKDTLAPTATMSDAPTLTNSVTVLDITIAGAGVSHYKYKLRESADAACSVAAGYSAQIAVGTKISDSISAYADAAEVCVVGKDSAGNCKRKARQRRSTGRKTPRLP